MRKRMAILHMILAGCILFGSSGVATVQAAQQKIQGIPSVEESSGGQDGENDSKEEVSEGKSGGAAGTDSDGRTPGNPDEKPEKKSGEEAETENGVAETVSEYADIAIAQVRNYVNVRSEPNTESEVLGKLYNNSAATVKEVTEDGWYRVHSGSVEGYVKAEYVEVGNEQLAKEVSTRYATVTTTTLFVRKEPTTDAKILTMLPEGDDLVVLDESHDGWVKVSTVEGDGYISTDYVKLSTEYIHAESKEEERERLAREEAERRAAAAAAEASRRAREAQERAKRSASRSGGRSSASGTANAGSAGGSAGSSGGGTSHAGSSNGQAVVDYAKQFVGNPYVYGGTSLTNGADCSGFVMSVYAAFGVSLPRNSAAQRGAGYEVSLSDIRPGDIVCYSGHVGIYAGNNTLLHASNERTGITYTSPVTYRPVLAVRRIF